MVSTWRWASSPKPMKSIETIVTSITETVMDRLRRTPVQISLRMNCKRMGIFRRTWGGVGQRVGACQPWGGRRGGWGGGWGRAGRGGVGGWRARDGRRTPGCLRSAGGAVDAADLVADELA